jgi:hypothetical protein
MTSAELKTKLADLFASVAIATNVPYVFFEHPAMLDALNQFANLAISILKKDQVNYLFKKYLKLCLDI